MRLHPDGEPSLQGHSQDGMENGTTVYTASSGHSPEPFPASDPVRQVERRFEHGSERQTRHFLQDGTEYNSRGIALEEAFEDERFTDVRSGAFLEEGGFEAFLAHAGMPVLDIASVPGINRFEEIWGRPMPAELKTFLTLLACTNWADLHACRTEPVGLPLTATCWRTSSVVVPMALAALLCSTPEATRSRACSFCYGVNRFPSVDSCPLDDGGDFFFERVGMSASWPVFNGDLAPDPLSAHAAACRLSWPNCGKRWGYVPRRY